MLRHTKMVPMFGPPCIYKYFISMRTCTSIYLQNMLPFRIYLFLSQRCVSENEINTKWHDLYLLWPTLCMDCR